MEQINKPAINRIKKLEITNTHEHWTIFSGVRNVMAVAAILLVGIFIYQQWIISSKVSNLEKTLQQSKTIALAADNVEEEKVNFLKQELFQKLKEEKIKFDQPLNFDSIKKDRTLMNSLIQAYCQLQAENRQLKNKLRETYSNFTEKKDVKQSKL